MKQLALSLIDLETSILSMVVGLRMLLVLKDAHEAIRPSSVYNTPEKNCQVLLDKDQLKLYTLIWNRFVASQMTAAVF